MAEVPSGILEEIFILASFLKIERMALASIFTKMAHVTKANGSEMSRRAKARRSGRMAQGTSEATSRE